VRSSVELNMPRSVGVAGRRKNGLASNALFGAG
jgi:hypothetical protein